MTRIESDLQALGGQVMMSPENSETGSKESEGSPRFTISRTVSDPAGWKSTEASGDPVPVGVGPRWGSPQKGEDEAALEGVSPDVRGYGTRSTYHSWRQKGMEAMSQAEAAAGRQAPQ